MKININDQFKVKLTPVGYAVLQKYYRDLYPPAHAADAFYASYKPDSKGYVIFHMHEIMDFFGPCYRFGSGGHDKAPFVNNELLPV